MATVTLRDLSITRDTALKTVGSLNPAAEVCASALNPFSLNFISTYLLTVHRVASTTLQSIPLCGGRAKVDYAGVSMSLKYTA